MDFDNNVHALIAVKCNLQKLFDVFSVILAPNFFFLKHSKKCPVDKKFEKFKGAGKRCKKGFQM